MDFEQAEGINKRVHEMFSMGSDIAGDALKAKIEWLKYKKAINVIFNTHRKKFLKKLDEQEKARFNDFLNKGSFSLYQSSHGFGIFKPAQKIFSLPLADMLCPDIAKWINLFYPLATSFAFDKLDVVSLRSVIASEYRDNFFRLDEDTKALLLDPKRCLDELKFSMLYENGIEFVGDDRDIFIRRTVADVERASLYGHGNCGLMADAAFLEACNAPHSLPVTYLRFSQKSDVEKVQVLNCVAVGAWPDDGCMIIAPWLTKNPVFRWQNDIKKISSKFDTCDIICQITDQEKKAVRDQLAERHYSSWLTSDQRNDNFKKIADMTDSFLQFVTQSNPDVALEEDADKDRTTIALT